MKNNNNNSLNPWSQRPVSNRIVNPQEDFGIMYTQMKQKFESSIIMNQYKCKEDQSQKDLFYLYEKNIQLCQENQEKKLKLIEIMHDQKYRNIINPQIFKENIKLLRRLSKICLDVDQTYNKCEKMLAYESDTKNYVLNDGSVQIEISYEDRQSFFHQFQLNKVDQELLTLDDIDIMERNLQQKLQQLQKICKIQK